MDLAQILIGYEPTIRLGFFVGIFALVALWEWRAPQRVLRLSRTVRWGNNLGLVVLNTVLLRRRLAEDEGVAVVGQQPSPRRQTLTDIILAGRQAVELCRQPGFAEPLACLEQRAGGDKEGLHGRYARRGERALHRQRPAAHAG